MFLIKKTEVTNFVDDSTIYSCSLNYEEAWKLSDDTHIVPGCSVGIPLMFRGVLQFPHCSEVFCCFASVACSSVPGFIVCHKIMCRKDKNRNLY